jgi:thiosulfate/3-mercaptopyruvate sulfurtransferase
VTALISADELAERLGKPGLAVLEVSFEPSDAAFCDAHVPGARWAWWKALLWHETDRRFPEPETLAARLSALGIGGDDTLVLVGDPIQFATYAYWVLHMACRGNVLVLDGGRARWLSGGLPVESGEAQPVTAAEHPSGSEDFSAVIGRDGVLAALGGERVILDFRTPEEYAGERVSPASAPIDHGAERKGRIPGARHLHHELLLSSDGTFRSPDEIAAVFAEAGVGPDDEVIAYCRLSHRASLGWFALTQLLGRERVRVYDGSWTEWGSIVGMPIELGSTVR